MSMNKTTLVLLVLTAGIGLGASAEEDQAPGLTELTPQEIERYQFEVEESEVIVKDLSLGQRYALSTQRREMHDLIARTLGVLALKESRQDIIVLQKLVDAGEIRADDVRSWQSLGIVFGDILAKEFGLTWVNYEDDLGASKALRWRKTENYVFPVTMFSKRTQFREKIDVQAVFDKVAADIEAFKHYEQTRPVFESAPDP